MADSIGQHKQPKWARISKMENFEVGQNEVVPEVRNSEVLPEVNENAGSAEIAPELHSDATGTATGNLTVEALEQAAKAKRERIDWTPLLPEIISQSKTGKTKAQFLKEYAEKYSVKPLTVSQKYDKLRDDIKNSKEFGPEKKQKMLEAIKFVDGRTVPGLKRVHKPKEGKLNPVMTLAQFMGMVGDSPEVVGEIKKPEAKKNSNLPVASELTFPIGQVKVGQTPIGDITINAGSQTITIHRNEETLAAV